MQIQPPIAPFLDVQIHWAGRHGWPAGARLARAATGANLWLVTEGEIEVDSAQKWRLRAGNAFLVPKGTPRQISTPAGATWLSFTFHATLFRQFEALSNWPLPLLWTPDESHRALLQANLETLIGGWNNLEAGLLCDGLARTVFGLCWQACGAPELLGAKSPLWVARALDHLREHPQTSIAEWASASGYSPAQFRRRFHDWFHEGPQHYLLRHRLELARHQLRHSQSSVAQIGQNLGFTNLSHFTRAFRQRHGLPPAQFRRALRDEL